MGCGGSKKALATETTEPADTTVANETSKPAGTLLETGTKNPEMPEVKPAAAEADPVTAPITTEEAPVTQADPATGMGTPESPEQASPDLIPVAVEQKATENDKERLPGGVVPGDRVLSKIDYISDATAKQLSVGDVGIVEGLAPEPDRVIVNFATMSHVGLLPDQFEKATEVEEPKPTEVQEKPLPEDGLELDKQLDIKVTSGCCPSGRDPSSALGFLRCCDAKAEADQA